MSLYQKLQNDLCEAQIQKKVLELSVLRLLSSAIHNKEIEKRTKLAKSGELDLENKSKLTDDEIMLAIASEVKKRKESIEQFQKGGRLELADKEKLELAILQKYLPEQLSESEIRKIVEETIQKLGAKSVKEMGLVMKEVTSQTKGKAEGAIVSRIVQELLKKE